MATTTVFPTNATPQTGTIKGRRKLQFTEAQRFKGKHFFLDLKGYKRAKDLQLELTARGATVQDYMDKNVRYVITNQSQTLINQAKSNIGSSNPTTPSTGGSQLLSPLSAPAQSPAHKKPSPQFNYFTRSRKLVEMGKGNAPKAASSDVLLNAARWKIKIVHVNAVEKELKKLKPLSKQKEVTYKKTTPKYAVRKLRQPFLKVEDKSRQYKPIIYETAQWPRLDLNCSGKASPFDINYSRYQSFKDDSESNSDHSDTDNENMSSNSGKGRAENKNNEAGVTKRRKLVREEKRAGFCEPCSVKYEDLIAHLKSECHQKYANNESNFAKLDELIAQCISLDDFLTEAKTFSRSSITPEFDVGSPSTLLKSPLVKDAQLTLKKVTSPVPLPPRKRVGWTSPYDQGSHHDTPAKKKIKLSL